MGRSSLEERYSRAPGALRTRRGARKSSGLSSDGTEEGICRGHENLRKLFAILAARKPKARQFYRTGYFTDGKKVIWEYPHATPTGEQMDFVEVMEIENGLIQHHRVYWGWFGFNVLKKDQYRH
jgi:hypothetical protein